MDIMKLNYMDELELDFDYTMPDEFYETVNIINIKNLHIKGYIDSSYNIDIHITGIMILKESLTLEEIEYPIDIKIEENIENNDNYLKNNGNTLDILTLLWENIVLEVPMRVEKDRNSKTKLKGDKWELL